MLITFSLTFFKTRINEFDSSIQFALFDTHIDFSENNLRLILAMLRQKQHFLAFCKKEKYFFLPILIILRLIPTKILIKYKVEFYELVKENSIFCYISVPHASKNTVLSFTFFVFISLRLCRYVRNVNIKQKQVSISLSRQKFVHSSYICIF